MQATCWKLQHAMPFFTGWISSITRTQKIMVSSQMSEHNDEATRTDFGEQVKVNSSSAAAETTPHRVDKNSRIILSRALVNLFCLSRNCVSFSLHRNKLHIRHSSSMNIIRNPIPQLIRIRSSTGPISSINYCCPISIFPINNTQ